MAWRWLRRAAVAALLLFGGVTAWLGFVWPPPSWWGSHWPARTAFMAMREGRVEGPRRYQPIPLDSMGPWLPRAAPLAEDDAFYSHHGIDWHALRQALGYRRGDFDWANARDMAELRRAMGQAAARRDRLRGASTITQQLAKNLYLSPSRNPLRKLKEAAIAYRLEWALSKQRILALYLNVAELGPNVWGVQAASRVYFDRDARRISLDQAALLMGTLPHPLTSNPALRPGRTRWRANLVLRRMRGEDVVMPEEAEEDKPPPAPSVPAADSVPLDSIRMESPPPGPVKPDSAPPDSARKGPVSPPGAGA